MQGGPEEAREQGLLPKRPNWHRDLPYLPVAGDDDDLIKARGTDNIGWAAEWLTTRLAEAGPQTARVYKLARGR